MERTLQIKEELEVIAPNLAKLSKGRPSLPNDYFANMQDQVMGKINALEEAPSSQYFASMQDQVISKTIIREARTIKFFPVVKWAAAACAGILMLWLPYNYISSTSAKVTTNEIAIDLEDQQEVDYLLGYLNTDADFNYLQSITSIESIPNNEIPISDEIELSDEELEMLIEM